MATTICFINQKGGCGKSSTCFHLAGSFALRGHRVLLVDADPQGSLSQGFLGSATAENLPVGTTLASLFDDEFGFADFQSLPQPTDFERISIVPSNQHLAQHNRPVPENEGMKQFAVREVLETVTGYDIILIDCPPNLYLCSWASMVAADFVVIPVPPEDFGTQGLRTVHQAVDSVRKLNPGLRRLGHLITRYDARLLVHQSYHEKLRTLYRDSVLNTVIPEASAFKVALACRKPVGFYSARSPAARLTDQLAGELMDRIAAKYSRQHVA
ncbi:MAG TPA: ParA family protein [Pirellulaceae bacterium]|nr:ParA family protein [Pirellulaceae bacterium]